MQKRFGLNSIRYKLSLGILLTTVTALLVSGSVIVLYELRDYRAHMLEDIQVQSNLIGQASAAALQFEDAEVAAETLTLLQLSPKVLAAAIRKPDGTLFAHYQQAAHAELGTLQHPNIPLLLSPGAEPEIVIDNDLLRLSAPILFGQEYLGSIMLITKYGMQEHLARVLGIVATVTLLALIVSMLLSYWIQSRITRPVMLITELANWVVLKRDYSLRAEAPASNDEIGYLVQAFNTMLNEIELRTAALEVSNRQLESEAHERADAEQALRSSELRHRTLVMTLTSVVWQADARGNFVTDQPGWSAYTGQSAAQYLGKGWIQAIHPDDRGGVQSLWLKACEDLSPFATQLRLWHDLDAGFRHINLNAVALKDTAGVLQQWIGVIEDIHEQIQSTQEIRRLNSELEQRVEERTADLESANKELEAFSYSVSHDLRAPLRSIDGFSQALLEDYQSVLDATGQNYLARVRAAAQRMGILIDDLLKLSHVSRMDIARDMQDLSSIAAEVIQGLRESEPERRVKVQIEPGLQAYGDARLLRVVLENLLNNAWKYTGKCTKPLIEFGTQQINGSACFYVKDNGAGFDMTYASRLFSAFQRLHDSRDFSGSGIGLATVNRIISRHGGRIWAQAEPDKGAVFYFTLQNTQAATQGERHEAQTHPAGRR
uniref:ATP-binding protein n=1 Tax=Marinobacterium profundum TaxID=1714300 RepID=UPI001FDEEFDC|nr:ATP-binding protein [Marinobacterium profundum]